MSEKLGFCKTGIEGQYCDSCQQLYYGFSSEGCKHCNCNTLGSKNDSCDLLSGDCECQPNVMFSKCDACTPGYFDFPNCRPILGKK